MKLKLEFQNMPITVGAFSCSYILFHVFSKRKFLSFNSIQLVANSWQHKIQFARQLSRKSGAAYFGRARLFYIKAPYTRHVWFTKDL